MKITYKSAALQFNFLKSFEVSVVMRRDKIKYMSSSYLSIYLMHGKNKKRYTSTNPNLALIYYYFACITFILK